MSKWYAATELSADPSGLDHVPVPGDYTDLETGDKCFVLVNNLHLRVYEYNEASTETNDLFGLAQIPADNVSGTGAWIQARTSGIITQFAGGFANHFDAVVTEAGGVVSLDFEGTGGIPGLAIFPTDLISVPIQSIVLSAGSDSAPTANYIYVLETDPAVLAVGSEWPAAMHCKVAYTLIPSASHVSNFGAYVNQNWNDGNETDGTGHLTAVSENIRLTQDGAHWHSGCAGNGATDDYITIVTDDTPDSAYFVTSAGVCFQMHRHTVPAFNSQTNHMHIVNAFGEAYKLVNDIRDEEVDSVNGSLTNKYYNIVFWQVANKGGEYAPVMMNMPSGTYTGLSNAINDVDGHDNYDIPRQYKEDSATGFLLCRITFRQTASAIAVHNTTDLRGQTPGTASGTSLTAGTEFADNQFNIFNVLDATKIVDFDLAGIATGNIRTIEIPDADMIIPIGTLAGATELNYNGVKKFETSAIGATLTGVLDVDGVTLNNDEKVIFGPGETTWIEMFRNGTTNNFEINFSNNDEILKAVPNGSTTFYYNGSKRIVTSQAGMNVWRGSGVATIKTEFIVDLWSIGVYENTPLILQAENVGETLNTLFKGDPDGGASLYFAGLESITTTATGIKIFDTDGDDPLLTFKDSGGSTVGTIQVTDGNMAFESSDELHIYCTADGGVDLYYDSTIRFKTTNTGDGGVLVRANSGTEKANLYFDGTTFIVESFTTDVALTSLLLAVDNAAGDTSSGILITGGGSVNLYYDAALVLETTAAGISVSNTGQAVGGWVIEAGTANMLIKSLEESATVKLQGTNGSGALRNIITGDPDGLTEVYHNSTVHLATRGGGIDIYDDDGHNLRETFSGINYRLINQEPAGELYLKGTQTDTTVVDMITMDPDGNVKLYASGNLSVVAGVGSLGVYSNAGTPAWGQLKHDNTDIRVENNLDSGHVLLKGHTSASALVHCFLGDPDGPGQLYWAGLKAFETTETGFQVTKSSQSVRTWTVDVRSAGDIWNYADYQGGGFSFYGRNDADDADNTLLTMDPMAGFGLYHAGVLVLESFGTNQNGIIVWSETGTEKMTTTWNGMSCSHQCVTTTEAATTLKFSVDDDGGSLDNGLTITGSGSVKLFHAGASALETTPEGMILTSNDEDTGGPITLQAFDNTLGAQPSPTHGMWMLDPVFGKIGFHLNSSGGCNFRNHQAAGTFSFQGYTTADAINHINMVTMDPDGGVSIKYTGIEKFITSDTGITVTGVVVADGLTLGDDEVIVFGTKGQISSDGTKVIIQSSGGSETMAQFTPNGGCSLRYNANIRIATTATGADVNGILTLDGLNLLERSADPTEPSEGQSVIWMSDGTGKGDDGDILIASQAGGVTKWTTLFDHSAGAAW